MAKQSKVHFIKENKTLLYRSGKRIACDDWFLSGMLPSTENVNMVTCKRCRNLKVYKEAVEKKRYPLFQYLKD